MSIEDFNKYIISLVVGLFLGVLLTSRCNKTETSPVEKSNVIDSLTRVNDSIKIKVEWLDSVKDAKIIEVSTLNNDSTVKLFYKLIKE